jgi:hypothetical protein
VHATFCLGFLFRGDRGESGGRSGSNIRGPTPLSPRPPRNKFLKQKVSITNYVAEDALEGHRPPPRLASGETGRCPSNMTTFVSMEGRP